MHPEVVSEKAGLCPECGMALLSAGKFQTPRDNNQQRHSHHGAHEGFDKHRGHSVNIFKVKFWVSLALTLPIVLYSEVAQRVGIRLPELSVGSWQLQVLTQALLGSVVFWYGGSVFLIGAYREIRARLPGMMTLIALAIATAYLWSVYAVFAKQETLFWELSTLVTIMLLGHWIEMRAVSGAQGTLKELSKLLPDKAVLITHKSQTPISKSQTNPNHQITNEENETKEVPLDELRVGDWLLVKPGAKVPADGKIIEGRSELNEALLTGESKPVFKKEKDEVIAGSINGDGSLIVEITQIGEHTFLAGIKRLVAEAQASKSRLQQLADKAALLLTVVAIVAGGGTLATWLLAGAGIVFAMERLVAVLVVACPHALGLAIPLVASISTTKGARNGILVKQRLALEAARNIDTVLFDKTGTLTKGEYGVTDVIPVEGTEDEVIARAASVEYFSEHPIAQGIVQEAKRRKLPPIPAGRFERIPGKGAKAVSDGMVVKVGSYELLKDDGVSVPASVKDKAMTLAKQGKTVIFVLSGRVFSGVLALADVIRPESKEALRALKADGIRIAMITGDSEEVGKWVARELNVDEYYARVLPGEKASIVKAMQNQKHEARNPKQYLNTNLQNLKQRRLFGISVLGILDLFRILDFGFSAYARPRVAFVGDGVNDAPALTQADLGIAIGAGTNVAIESAGIILIKSNPRDIVKIIRLSRLTYRKMIQNLWWAAGYNIIAIPLAAGALATQGIFLEPAVAAILMSVSTVIVAFNAVLLRRQTL
jgi:Cu2+-exporting ATPase